VAQQRGSFGAKVTMGTAPYLTTPICLNSAALAKRKSMAPTDHILSQSTPLQFENSGLCAAITSSWCLPRA
jgi:hypothetical protein